MKTTKENIERTVYVFAEAKSPNEIENLEPGERPFEYRVKQYDYGDEKSVRIMEQAIILTIPEGIDITLECIRNLEEKIVAVEQECQEKVRELRERIRSLALIEYKPEET
jgi:hypothetical protein